MNWLNQTNPESIDTGVRVVEDSPHAHRLGDSTVSATEVQIAGSIARYLTIRTNGCYSLSGLVMPLTVTLKLL